ncbi:MAG: ribonucleoside triphosphate reductase [Halanaerobacter sp.]
MINYIKKRDGNKVEFKKEKITEAVLKAAQAVDMEDKGIAQEVTAEVISYLKIFYKEDGTPSVEQVQDLVEKTLIEAGHSDIAKAYILYREQHSKIRNTEKLFDDALNAVGSYLDRSDWRVKENSNMGYSLQGLNNHISSEVTAQYWLQEIYPQEIREKHSNGDLHIHDLGNLSVYCCGWDLKDLLLNGFGGVPTKVESKPPKHFRTALMQSVNFLYTLQGEAAGAMAFSNFDTYLAPFIAYDDLNYEEVKQGMQEFIYNLNVPTRVGFQCMSEDTEILTPKGWKKYNEVEVGARIKTFNVEENKIENSKVNKVFRRHYEGKMYNLTNRIQDQLISPEHRVVRKINGTNKYRLQPIEEVAKMKSPAIIPITAPNDSQEIKLSDEEIQLIAWIIAEGSLEKKGNWRRLTIYQSRNKNRAKFDEIIALLDKLGYKYTTHEGAKSLGDRVSQIRFNAETSRAILELFDQNNSINYIPQQLLSMSQRQSELFINTYIKGDGHEDCKITTTDKHISDELQQIIINSGNGVTVNTREATKIGSKKRYILRVIEHQDTYISDIKEVNYDGIIWCPNTDNETVIARRNGKVFITGNTPFTNITMDLNVPDNMKDEPVIIGGDVQEETYQEFQAEMDMLNRAFAEVMLEGDKKDRVFSFPIPTYNITPDFEWDNEVLDPVWEMTAKYGLPYFSNFVNSDMDPQDIRSMCCRLRIDNTELRKRGGGLFGSHPLTGSVGVCTLNMPRIGYQAESKEEFLGQTYRLMDIAQESLEIKREVLENLTENGLYPYSKFYLRNIKERFDEYWKNHFNTIGLNGMNEALENFMGCNIAADKGREFAVEVMEAMRDRLVDYQEETGNIYNLEATPAEGTSYRFAKLDRERFGDDIICANQERVVEGEGDPYYTNSSQLPVDHTRDIFEAFQLQDPLQKLFTGGTVLHGFIGEKMPSIESTKKLVKRLAHNFELPYYSLTPTFSICPKHGYIAGEHEYCPKCDAEIGYEEDEE